MVSVLKIDRFDLEKHYVHIQLYRILATHYNLDFQIWKLFQSALVNVISFHIWKSML